MDRKRIGIIYCGGKGWIGGVYYIQNIINALNTLPDEDKPLIDIYTEGKDKFVDLKKVTGYPYLLYNKFHENILLKCISLGLKAFCYSIGKRLSFVHYNKQDLFVFPNTDGDPKKALAWIPDFQDKYLPQLFDKKGLKSRDRSNRYVADHIHHLVLSSYDCENDFKKYFSGYQCQIHILHFAVTLPDYSQANIEDLRKKYGISGKYLFCPNQFWMHKNHAFLFRAYKKALDEGLNMQLICTGQLSDYRNPDYIKQLKDFISENHLESKIKVLGFISRENMLCLINNAHAVIQPSLFEGWSTVVEDAKAVNKFIFLSDLKVHHEQINKNVCFFDPHDEDDLCNKLLSVKPAKVHRDYQKNIVKFGQDFLDIINQYDF
jgi:glycosyltransferase involved in cell wall biosynthesis